VGWGGQDDGAIVDRHGASGFDMSATARSTLMPTIAASLTGLAMLATLALLALAGHVEGDELE
jgi:hypothetical protein